MPANRLSVLKVKTSTRCQRTVLVVEAQSPNPMSFLEQLDGIAHKVAAYSVAIHKQTIRPSASYRQAMEIILERVDQLAYVFVVAPFCYDSERIYENVKHSICAILQLIKVQQQHTKLSPEDEDFLMVLFETFTKLCVRLLCEDNFIQIKDTDPIRTDGVSGRIDPA